MFGVKAMSDLKAQIKQEKAARAILTDEEWETRSIMLAKLAADSEKERRHQELCEAIRSTGFWSFLR